MPDFNITPLVNGDFTVEPIDEPVLDAAAASCKLDQKKFCASHGVPYAISPLEALHAMGEEVTL